MKMCTLYFIFKHKHNTCTKHFEKLTTDNFNFVNKLYRRTGIFIPSKVPSVFIYTSKFSNEFPEFLGEEVIEDVSD